MSASGQITSYPKIETARSLRLKSIDKMEKYKILNIAILIAGSVALSVGIGCFFCLGFSLMTTVLISTGAMLLLCAFVLEMIFYQRKRIATKHLKFLDFLENKGLLIQKYYDRLVSVEKTVYLLDQDVSDFHNELTPICEDKLKELRNGLKTLEMELDKAVVKGAFQVTMDREEEAITGLERIVKLNTQAFEGKNFICNLSIKKGFFEQETGIILNDLNQMQLEIITVSKRFLSAKEEVSDEEMTSCRSRLIRWEIALTQEIDDLEKRLGDFEGFENRDDIQRRLDQFDVFVKEMQAIIEINSHISSLTNVPGIFKEFQRRMTELCKQTNEKPNLIQREALDPESLGLIEEVLQQEPQRADVLRKEGQLIFKNRKEKQKRILEERILKAVDLLSKESKKNEIESLFMRLIQEVQDEKTAVQENLNQMIPGACRLNVKTVELFALPRGELRSVAIEEAIQLMRNISLKTGTDLSETSGDRDSLDYLCLGTEFLCNRILLLQCSLAVSRGMETVLTDLYGILDEIIQAPVFSYEDYINLLDRFKGRRLEQKRISISEESLSDYRVITNSVSNKIPILKGIFSRISEIGTDSLIVDATESINYVRNLVHNYEELDLRFRVCINLSCFNDFAAGLDDLKVLQRTQWEDRIRSLTEARKLMTAIEMLVERLNCGNFSGSVAYWLSKIDYLKNWINCLSDHQLGGSFSAFYF